jgi:hypothetical protein
MKQYELNSTADLEHLVRPDWTTDADILKEGKFHLLLFRGGKDRLSGLP